MSQAARRTAGRFQESYVSIARLGRASRGVQSTAVVQPRKKKARTVTDPDSSLIVDLSSMKAIAYQRGSRR